MKRLLAILSVTAVIVAGCDSAAPVETTTTTTATTTTTTQAPTTTTTTTQPPTTTTTTLPPIDWRYVTLAEAPTVTVLDPGAEPRTILAYDMAVGASASSVVRQAISLEQAIDGETWISSYADVSSEIGTSVIAVDDEGYTLEIRYGSYLIHVANGLAASTLEPTYQGLQGSVAHILMSRSGEQIATETGDLPEGLSLAASEAAIFPDEPIGVGGQWQVDRDLAVNGLVLHRTEVVTVMAIEGSMVELGYEVTQSLGDDGLVLPGVEVSDSLLDSQGTGSVIVELTLPATPMSATTTSINLEATLAAEGQETSFTQTSDQQTSVTEGPLVDTSPVIIGVDLPAAPTDATFDGSANGEVIPNVLGADFSGDEVAIRRGDTSPKVIMFLAHWCPHCQREVELLSPWFEGSGDVDGVQFFSVATAFNPSRGNYPASDWLEGEGWPVPVIVDDWQSSVYRAYGAGAFPFWVFVNSDGTVAMRVQGELEIADLLDILDSLE